MIPVNLFIASPVAQFTPDWFRGKHFIFLLWMRLWHHSLKNCFFLTVLQWGFWFAHN